MADRFEIKKHYIPLSEERQREKGWNYITPNADKESDLAWQKASELGKDGWELVGVMPSIGSTYFDGDGLPFIDSFSHSYTIGYTLFFKRRVS